jgi:hypothetical protein
VLRKLFFLSCLLSLAAIDAPGAQAVARQDSAANAQNNRSGAWSARSSGGLTLMGMWTAVLDPSGTVTGTWTLVDAQGKTIAGGAWSAAKEPTRWNGAWRAVVAGRTGEYSGTFTADIDSIGLKGDARFVDLFEKAAQTIVRGGWRTGSQSGRWAIRASAESQR